MTLRIRAAAAALLLVAAACGGGGYASTDRTTGPSMLMATRSELQDFVTQAEAANPAAGSDSALQLLVARDRLATGDFKLDDRVILYVDGEPTLSDTFSVDAARQLTLPGVGPVSLQGVLRSELEDRMRQEIARIVRQPVVRTRALVRIGVIGAVRAPGFHWVPADGQVTDPITAAGGYTPGAQQDQQRVERNGQAILAGEALDRAIQTRKAAATGRSHRSANHSGAAQRMPPILGIPPENGGAEEEVEREEGEPRNTPVAPSPQSRTTTRSARVSARIAAAVGSAPRSPAARQPWWNSIPTIASTRAWRTRKVRTRAAASASPRAARAGGVTSAERTR